MQSVVKRVLISTPFLHLNNLPWVHAFESVGVATSFVTLSESLRYPDHIPVHHLGHVAGSRRKMLYYPGLLRLVRILRKERPDVLILRELSITNIMLSVLSRLLCGSSVLFYDQNPVELTSKLRLLSRFLVAPYLITTAPGAAYLGKAASLKPGAMFRKAAFVPFFHPARVSHEDIRTKYGDDVGPLKVVCVGKYRMPRKNLCLLVESIAERLVDGSIFLTIMGKLDPGDHPEYRKLCGLCESLIKRGASISILANLSQDEVFTQFKNAHIFILPSVREPASISQIEAMAHGLPAIISKDNGTSYVISEGENGFLIEPHAKDISNVFEKILAGKQELLGLSLKALHTIEQRFSREAFLRSLNTLLVAKGKTFEFSPAADVDIPREVGGSSEVSP